MERSKFRQPESHKLGVYNALDHVPIKNDERRCTDILCIIVGVTLTVVLAVFAIVTYNRPQYLREVFPADSEGITCGYEYPGFNYIYFAKPTDMSKRYCARSCPASNAKPLQCKQNSGKPCEFGSTVQYYDNEPVENEYGMFCLPKDEGNRKTLMDQMKSYNRDLYYNSVNVGSTCLMIVAVISVLYMFLVQCCPKVMNRVSVVVGVLALIAFTATVIAYPSNISPMFRWVVFAVALLFVLIMICTFAKYFSVWGLNGIFLEYGTKFICARLYLLVLPVLFLGLGVAFYFFEILMYRSFWSFGQLQFDPAVDLYHRIKNPTLNFILTFFQIIQIIWGTMFLKQSFNYLISAEAVEWYYGNGSSCGNATFTLVCKHLGSVIACAFMNAFFGIADFIFDALIPTCDDSRGGFFYCCNRFAGFFDLARSDSLTLVYVSGNAYCNSARYSEYLSINSAISRRFNAPTESQSASRIYRIAAHFALGGIVTLVAFWIFGFTFKHQVAIPAMLVLLLISMGVSTFFISLHADAGEAIMVLYLMDQEFTQRRGAKQHEKSKEIEKELNNYFDSHPSHDKSKL